MNPYQLFKTDQELETTGIKLDYGDFYVMIARAGGANEKYTRLLRDRVKPLRQRINNGALDNQVSTKILAEVYADSVILGWGSKDFGDGTIPNENDEPMLYNRDNVVKLFIDLPELFGDIQAQATIVGNFRAEELKESEKN